jgi:putative phosphoserine phosphatase/1-acylglycerol-3-phosphate O-acyltransferase
VHPGTIDVRVLPPVDTGDWRAETVAEHVAHVRGLFVDALAGRRLEVVR